MASTEEIMGKVKKIIAEQLGVDEGEITNESHFIDDLGADSLDIVELIMELEEEFDISIPFNANEPEKSDFDISSMGTIIAAVERLVAEKG